MFPEYTEETLPLAFRRVDVVVEVYIGSFVCSSLFVSALGSSALFGPSTGGGMAAAVVAVEAFQGVGAGETAGPLVGGSSSASGLGPRM